jgi:hypothetical protein
MKDSALTFCWTLKVLAIVFAGSQLCFAQDRSKQETRPEESVLRQLHPKPLASDPPKGISLLAGYEHKSAPDFEGNQVGEISSSGGVKIKYEMGFSQGMAVDPSQKAAYVWYREQKINGRITRYALRTSNLLVVSIPLGEEPNTLHCANFYGTITKPDNIADMLLMILPFAYK